MRKGWGETGYCPQSVSYTHLDVYKRQELRWWRRLIGTDLSGIWGSEGCARPPAFPKGENTEMEERTYVNDIDRSIYDIRNEEKDAYRIETGLSPAIVEQISREKGDPLWMELFRLEARQIYNNMKVQDWGPSLKGLDMDNICLLYTSRCV